jgi:hypothetical protein
LLDVGLHLLHQPIELIWGSVRLFLFILPRFKGGILENNLLLLLLVLGATTGPALVLALLPLVDIVIELLIVVVLFTVVTSSFTLHLFNYVVMI